MFLEDRLNYDFKDKALLQLALTHSSYGGEKSPTVPKYLRDNERLEFLGDSVVSLYAATLFYKRYPNENEGILTNYKASMVSGKTLAKVAASIELDRYIMLGVGEQKENGGTKVSLISGTLEAVLGAIYLDGGFQEAMRVCEELLTPFISLATTDTNYKGQLQLIIQRQGKSVYYELISARGLQHDKTFSVAAMVEGKELGQGEGKNHKEAEQDAALQAIMFLSR